MRDRLPWQMKPSRPGPRSPLLEQSAPQSAAVPSPSPLPPLPQSNISLVAVGQSDGRAQFVLRDVLEAHQMFAGTGRVARLLISPRNAEAGRVQRIQLKRMLEGVDRLRYCLSCADAAPRKYQLSASLGSIR